MSVRKARLADIQEIIRLLTELGRPKPEDRIQRTKFRKTILEYLHDKDRQVFVAVHDSKIVGMASLVFLSRLNQTSTELWIPDLIINENYRSIGIGRQIMKTCEKIAKQRKCFRIRLESGNKRKDAHLFYRKIGFEQSSLTFTKMTK